MVSVGNYMDGLVQNVLDGDQDAYRDFLLSIEKHTQIKIKNIIKVDYQEDLVQEVLLAVHKSLCTLDSSRPVLPWINGILYHKTMDLLRKIYKDKAVEITDEEIAIELNEVEDRQLIEKALSFLSTKESRVLILLKYEGYSVREVASLINTSESNIKVITFRAIKKIKEFFIKEGFYG